MAHHSERDYWTCDSDRDISALSGYAEASVEVRVIDAYGISIPNATFRFIDVDTGNDYAPFFKTGVASHVPYGKYRIKYGDRMFLMEKQLTVDRPHVCSTLVVLLPSPGPLRVRGRIRPMPHRLCELIVKVFSPFKEDTRRAQVQSDGTFLVEGISLGDNIFVILNGAEVLVSKIVTVRPQMEPVIIDVGSAQ